MSQAAVADTVELTLSRRFAVSPEILFRAWTDPHQFARWAGPRGVHAEVEISEARVGGTYRIAFYGESGALNIAKGVYREVSPPDRLVFTWVWEAPESGASSPCGNSSSPLSLPTQDTLVTLTFRAIGNETEMTLTHARFPDADARDRHVAGWSGSFDKLADLLWENPTLA